MQCKMKWARTAVWIIGVFYSGFGNATAVVSSSSFSVSLIDCRVSENVVLTIASQSLIYCISNCMKSPSCSSVSYSPVSKECIGMQACTLACPETRQNWLYYCLKKDIRTCTSPLLMGCYPRSLWIMISVFCPYPACYVCDGGGVFIHHDLRCDEVPDCPLGDDEHDCETYNCAQEIINLGRPGLLCNGFVDCMDGKDEAGCYMTPTFHFMCDRECNLCTDGSLKCQ